MSSLPKEVLDNWLNFVNSGDLDGVTRLYDPSALLIPTFSTISPNTPEEIREYFIKVSQRPQLLVTLHEASLVIQDLGNGVFSLGGNYRWDYTEDEEPVSVEARFTYTVDLNRSTPILHHHSSQVPG